MKGTTNRKIIVVPCIVNSSLYVLGSRRVLSAWLSCRRISSASTPPSMKKTKVRTMYMIPIRLWSVVVTQDVQPVGCATTALAFTWGTGVRTCSVVAAMELGRPRLCLELLAGHGGRVVGGLQLGLARLDELLVLRRGDRPHASGHVRVVAPAQLGALAGERLARELAGDLEPGVVRVARDGVELAAELRDPPRMGDVLPEDVERDRRVDRHVHRRVREDRLEVVVAAVLRVGVAPDVLLARDADVQALAVGRQAPHGVGDLDVAALVAVGAGVRRVADTGQQGEREDPDDDEDDRGADGPADLQAGVAADLGGHGALSRPELEQRVEEQALDADEDDQRDRE